MMKDTATNPTSSCRYCGCDWSDTCESHEGWCSWLREKQSFLDGREGWNDFKMLSDWWREFYTLKKSLTDEGDEN